MKENSSDIGSIMAGGREVAVKLTRSRRRKRTIAFAIEPPATLRVMAPARSNLAAILKMIEARTGWIARRFSEFQFAPPEFTDGTTVTYLGHAYHLQVTSDDALPQSCRLAPRRMMVNIHGHDMSHKNMRDEVRLEIMLWLKKRAKTKIQKRVDFWARHMGVKYKKLVLSNPERQWGSCSAQNIIRLNWRLIMAPLRLIDYVIVHELAHVTHKNHSPRYWRHVQSFMPDCQLRRKQLRQMGHRLAL